MANKAPMAGQSPNLSLFTDEVSTGGALLAGAPERFPNLSK